MKEQPKLIDASIRVDDRGYLMFSNQFQFDNIKRFYVVKNHRPFVIRAWHGHLNEKKYMFSLCGTFLIGTVDMSNTSRDFNSCNNAYKFVLSSLDPKILYIPNGYYNGIMNFGKNDMLIIFSTSTINESKNDDIRLPYDYWNIWNIENR